MPNLPPMYNYVTIPEFKCSFFLMENSSKKDDNVKMLIRLEEGRHKGIIVEVSDFTLEPESSRLNFNYDVVYNPYEKIANVKSLELFVKKCVIKVVTYAIENSMRIIEDAEQNGESDSPILN